MNEKVRIVKSRIKTYLHEGPYLIPFYVTGVVSSRRLRLDPDPGGADSLRKIDIESVLWWYHSLRPESAESGSHGCGFTMQNIHTYV
jgi:hypothetical protein